MDRREYEEKQLDSEYLYKGAVINVRRDRALLPDGQEAMREVVEHPGGVGIALEDEDGTFFLVEQWRYAQSEVLLEFPAGKKEPGEDPLTTAKREIIEETGWSGKDYEYLGELVPTGAYDSERIAMYYAKKDEYHGQHLDKDEHLNLTKMTLDELTADIVAGKIPDAKTVAMVFLLKERKKG